MRTMLAIGILLISAATASAACLPDMAHVSLRGKVVAFTVRGDKKTYYKLVTEKGLCVKNDSDADTKPMKEIFMSVDGATEAQSAQYAGKIATVIGQVTETRADTPMLMPTAITP